MKRRIDLLALSYTVDELCADNDIDPAFVIQYLIDEGLIDLDEYFKDEDEE